MHKLLRILIGIGVASSEMMDCSDTIDVSASIRKDSGLELEGSGCSALCPVHWARHSDLYHLVGSDLPPFFCFKARLFDWLRASEGSLYLIYAYYQIPIKYPKAEGELDSIVSSSPALVS